MYRVLFGMSLLVPLATNLAVLPAAAQDAQEPGFVSLFNGKDLTGWRVHNGKSAVWGAADGVLYVDGQGGGWLLTEKEYADFELRFEYKMPVMGNSGVAIRAPRQGNPAFDGLEIQLLDDATWKKNYKELKPVQYTGAIYDIVAPSKDATKPAGEWSAMHIAVRGRRITVTLNGQTTVDANLDDHKDRVQANKERKLEAHPGLLRTTGLLGFQSHDGRVEFRNVRIKVLEGK